MSLFGSQRALDALLDDVTSLLAIPRESSHVRATSKGLVAGQVVLRSGNVLVDCSAARHGQLVGCWGSGWGQQARVLQACLCRVSTGSVCRPAGLLVPE